MKIILLGASGQLGSEWQTYMDVTEHDDVVFLPYTSTQLDITHYREVSNELREQQPDVVINCAAFTDVDGAEEHRKKAQKINVEAVLYLAELSQELEYQLVHYSTDYVFPGYRQDRRALPDGYPEDHSINPVNWYGRTKWEGEQAIRNTNDDHLVIRISWLCGQYGSNFIKTMLKLGRERDKVQVVNDQWGSPTYAGNVVKNTYNLIQEEQRGTFHLTSGGLITWHDLATEAFERSDIDVEVEAVPSEEFQTRADRPFYSKLDTSKIEGVPGSELVDWKEGLDHLLAQLDKS